MSWIISQLFFYENPIGIKEPPKCDMPLNKETDQIFGTSLKKKKHR